MSDYPTTTGTPRAHGEKQLGGKQLAPRMTPPRQQDGNRRVGGKPERPESQDRWQEEDEKLDQALKGTFPASDPFSI